MAAGSTTRGSRELYEEEQREQARSDRELVRIGRKRDWAVEFGKGGDPRETSELLDGSLIKRSGDWKWKKEGNRGKGWNMNRGTATSEERSSCQKRFDNGKQGRSFSGETMRCAVFGVDE